MTIGSHAARATSAGAGIPKKLLSLLLAYVLAASLAPSAAWAQLETPAADASAEEPAAEPAAEEQPGVEPAEEPAEPTEEPQPVEAAPDPAPAAEEPAEAEPAAVASAESASAPAATPAPRAAASTIDGVRIKASATADLPSKIGVGQPLYAWAFVEEDDGWWDVEEVEIDDYSGATFQWYRGATKVSYAYGASSYRGYAPIDGAVSQTYQASESDQGSYLAVKVTLPGGGEFWSAASTSQVTDGKATLTSVAISGKAKTGQVLSATAYGEPQYSWQDPEPVMAGVAFQWLRGAAEDGGFAPIEGAAGATYQVGPEDAGCYLKVVASSSNTVEAVAGPVAAAGSPGNEERLAAALEALENDGFSGWCPNPVYGVDANLNDMTEAELAKLGFSDVISTVSSAAFANPDPRQTGGVDTSSGSSNGDIAYFYVSPDEKGGLDYGVIRKLDLTFSLVCGDASDTYAPAKATVLAWDEGRVERLLKEKAASLAIGFAPGEGAGAVTQDLTLPNKLAGRTWSEVTWTSSDPEAVNVTGYAWEDRTGKVTRSAADRTVRLTATVGVVTSGGPETTIEKTFDVTVKGDPEKVAAAKAELQQKVDASFTYDNVRLAETGAVADRDALTGDVQLPVPATIGVDGKYYEVAYTASADAVVVNGWAGTVYRPLPGEDAAQVDIVLTVTDKANPEISAAKTLAFTVAPLEQADIDRELALMDAAVAGYAAAIANDQDADAVTSDLHAFQKTYLDANGNLAWAYDRTSADAAGAGIVPVDLEGYDPMGTAGWRLFKSSDPSVVSHENLLVTQPEYNAKVTIESRLASEKYARYAERYPDNAAFQKLAGRDVSAEFAVRGESGQEDPFVTATCSVIGVDKDGAAQTWAAAEPYTLDVGATVADLAEALFAKTGMAADFGVGAWGWSLNAITSPFDAGLTLRWGTLQGLGWMFYVNGQDLGKGAGDYALQPGDRVIWRYGSWQDPAPADKLSVTCEVIGTDADGAAQTWASATAFALDEGATAADLSEALFEQAGLTAQTGTGAYGWYLTSIASPYTGEQLGSVETSPGVWSFWQLFVNGELANVGAGGCVLAAGDVVTWCYGSDGTLPGQVAASCEVIGLDANGNAQRWAAPASYTMVEGATAADLTEQMLAKTGLEGTVVRGDFWYLSDMTSPYDDALTLAFDPTTGAYWQMFVNGEWSLDGADAYTLQPGDSVTWCYTADPKLPDPDAAVPDPNAPRPSYDASWPGFAGGGAPGGAVVSSPTPAESAELAWSYRYADAKTGVSEPLVVDGDVYLVTSGELRRIDADTGEVLAAANVGGTFLYSCRPAYADGVIVVPFDDGSLAAFTADRLTCVWKTAPLPTADGARYQSLSSLTVADGRVLAAFTVVGAGGVGVRGALLCASLADGRVLWTKVDDAADGSAAGYYWAGAAASGGDVVIGDEAGAVTLLDGATGAAKSSVALGAPCRAGIVEVPAQGRAAGAAAYAAVTTDGTLHLVVRESDQLRAAGSVRFAERSTSTPAVAGGKAFVCGADAEGYGTLSVIDLGTLAVDCALRGGRGDAQSAPLVSVQGDGTYAYFTCNGLPGGVYGYRLGDEAAYLLFAPEGEQRQYTAASVVADAQGNLYYTNDSGTLFALKGRAGAKVTFEANGGSYVAPVYVALGTALIAPADPVRDGFTFAGWFADEACTTPWSFEAKVEGPLTLYAKWTAKGQGGDPEATGSSSRPLARTPFGSAPAAARSPLAEAVQAVKEAAAPEAAQASAAGSRAKTLAASGGAADAGGSEALGGGLNPLAASGLALGAVGLVAVGAYVLIARRRNGGLS
ncbi:DUF4430 domain-containing protein [Arabiibacter massiliensis]|uniref:DUF4430 domain-containing protein n=1 Tax=Arabiibacter massiliensis TaxID=1870985 RepID=UPI0009B9F827|nr:DUF4430 domain-containing protein [Arabiibacter massiliensis]